MVMADTRAVTVALADLLAAVGETQRLVMLPGVHAADLASIAYHATDTARVLRAIGKAAEADREADRRQRQAAGVLVGDTDPPAVALSLADLLAGVSQRDDFKCVRCGTVVLGGPRSLHHRVLGNRKANEPWNLILLCGSGTTGCHGWVHAHPTDARDQGGWIISRHAAEPQLVPVLYRQPGREGWFRLLDDLTLIASEAA